MAILAVAHVGHHALAVDVSGPEREQLGAAQPRAVEGHERRAVLGGAGAREDRRDQSSGGHVGLAVARVDPTDRRHRVEPPERDVEEEAQRREADVDRPRVAALDLERVALPRSVSRAVAGTKEPAGTAASASHGSDCGAPGEACRGTASFIALSAKFPTTRHFPGASAALP